MESNEDETVQNNFTFSDWETGRIMAPSTANETEEKNYFCLDNDSGTY